MAPARPIHDLDCAESFRTAAGKVVWTRFEEMMSFREQALTPGDVQGIKDMRVASRRLRAALEVFADVFPSRRLRPLLREIKQLADTLGEVRDRDVLIERLEADMKGRAPTERMVLTEMIAELAVGRDEARDTLQRVLTRQQEDGFSRAFLSFVAQEAL